MISKLAIEKAIEGGYQLPWITRKQIAKLHRDEFSTIALDPTFWQALGKALGWGDSNKIMWAVDSKAVEIEMKAWENNAHRFYDLILTGQPTEAYWKELLHD